MIPSWLRWILMFPIAVLACVAIQMLVVIASDGLPLSDSLQDSTSQFVGSIFGAWCFVYVAAKLAPRGKGWPAALSATILYIGFMVTTTFLLISAESPAGYALWWIVLTGLVGVGAAVLALWQVSTQGKEGRQFAEG